MMDPAGVLALAALVKSSQPIAAPFAKKAATLLGKLLGPGASALGERLGEFLSPPASAQPSVLDTIAMWRHENMTLLLGHTAERLAVRGLEPRPIPISVLFPLLEAASLVDDETLREMWAELLASSLEADEHQHPMWVKILAQMSAEDARAFAAASVETDARGYVSVPPDDQSFFAQRAPSSSDARLLALGLVTHAGRSEAAAALLNSVGADLTASATAIALTEVGAQFRRAVMPLRRP